MATPTTWAPIARSDRWAANDVTRGVDDEPALRPRVLEGALARLELLAAALSARGPSGNTCPIMTRSHGLFGLLFAAGVTLGACTGPYSTTSDSEGSSTGEECPVGGLNCPCTTGNSCDEGLVCASKRCVKPGGEETSTGEPTTDVDPTTEGPSTTMVGSDCDPGGAGGPDVSCPDERPYCVAGECFACGGIECGDVSPAEPLCNQATGLCAACLCDDAAPVCDPESHTCSVCTAHGDCPDSACDLWTGACFPGAATLWVDGAGRCDDAGPGDKETPLCELDVAFERVSAAAPGHQAVRVRPGSYSVQGPLRAPGQHVVALVHATGEPGDPAVTITAASTAALAVDPGGKLLVDALHLANSGADGFTCAMGEARLDRLTISEATMHGVAAEACELVIRRGVLVSNVLAGVSLAGGSLRLENSYVSKNGNPQTGAGGIYLAEGAELDAVYSTWVENRGQAGTPFAVSCSDDGAKEKVTVRNSLAINLGSNTLCEGATVEHTGWSTDMVTGENMIIALADLDAYLTADGSMPGVYRVAPGTGLETLGAWEQGDPVIDFDGDVRPASDNAPDFAGADRVAR